MLIDDFKALFLLQPGKYIFSQISYDDKSCQQELYMGLPEGKSGFPTVVYLHGGGLTGDGIEFPLRLINGDFCCIAVRYRTSGGQWNALDSLEDAVQSVAWVLKHIAEYGGDPRKVFIGGTSAGAWQSAMVGMNPSLLAKYGCDNRQLAGLLLVSGQMGTHFTLKKDLEYKEHSWAPVIDEYAPLKYVSADVPPILMMTGDFGKDMPTRAEENAYMAACLKAVGHKDATHLVMGGHEHCDIHFSCDRMMLRFILRRLEEIGSGSGSNV